jgi:hypothetical protein
MFTAIALATFAIVTILALSLPMLAIFAVKQDRTPARRITCTDTDPFKRPSYRAPGIR